jgi:hypothetical protein
MSNILLKATLVRLLTINSMNAYITSWVLYLAGGSEDPCLLLPAWISIASVRVSFTLINQAHGILLTRYRL